MIPESTDTRENLFLALSTNGITYVIPLSDVGQTVSEIPQQMPEVRLPGHTGDSRGAVIFQDDSGLAALTAGQIEGIIQLPPASQFEIPEEAQSPRNRWIAGAAFWEEERKLIYLLDCRQLKTCLGRGPEDG